MTKQQLETLDAGTRVQDVETGELGSVRCYDAPWGEVHNIRWDDGCVTPSTGDLSKVEVFR